MHNIYLKCHYKKCNGISCNLHENVQVFHVIYMKYVNVFVKRKFITIFILRVHSILILLISKI